MLQGQKISLIIPCRNEEKSLRTLLSKIPPFIDEVIVVDNNSADCSAKVAREMGAIVLTEKRNLNGIGYGFAYQTGFSAATGDVIVAMDGDDTYSTRDIRKIIQIMKKNKLDFVSCNRQREKRNPNISYHRLVGAWALSFSFNVLFQKNVKDILSGMWVVRSSVLPLLNLTPGGWNFSISIKASAMTCPACKFIEIPVSYQDRKVSGSKQDLLRTGWNHGLFILRFWLKTITSNQNSSTYRPEYSAG